MERLILTHLCSVVSPTLDPLQFAYRPNIGLDGLPCVNHTSKQSGLVDEKLCTSFLSLHAATRLTHTDLPAWPAFPNSSQMDMSVPVPSLLLGLGGKCILNWALVFLQRDHIWSSFICVFSLSVSVIDTILTILVTSIHLLQDVNILGLRLGQPRVDGGSSR
uniref:Uncharacterized protein n=1 Tax=Knipowitschia caucasica TaxID=637954 RepID=A0AAV2JXV2_KNICA